MSEPIKIWSRRSEWDYSWIKVLKSPEIILCFVYEYSRYALLCLPSSFSFPSKEEGLSFSMLPHLLQAAAANVLGPVFFLLSYSPTQFNFPLDPYRVARKRVRFDPEMFLRLLDDFSFPSAPEEILLPVNVPKAVWETIWAQAQIRKRYPRPPVKRGAGARVRQARVALTNLGALKLQHLMSAPEAIRYTEKILRRPLFGAESQWSRARKHALETLRPYHAEAAVLLEASKEKRSFSRLSCSPAGELEVDWISEPSSPG
jgi:hypothetical protein